MDEVDIVVAHRDRATLRVGNIFLKVDPDEAQVDIEVEAMMLAPVPTPVILWREPPVLALAAVPGKSLGRLGGPSSASPAAWCAAGRLIRKLHDAPLPPWRGRSNGQIAAELDAECAWLIESGLVSSGVVARNRRLADTALRVVAPVFTHGDLQLDHIFIQGDEVTGVLDWSEAGPGDPLCDLR